MVFCKNLVFNPFQVNTWLVYEEKGSCLVIDPACSDDRERKILLDYIKENDLKPEMIMATHGHFDHLPGVNFIRDEYKIPFYGHRDDLSLLQFARQQGEFYGFEFDVDPPEFDRFLMDGDLVDWGAGTFKVLHVPGHSRGSLAYFFEDEGFVITGDALFRESIGRTDLPGGDFDTLAMSIKKKLFTLEGSTRVCSGHGPDTSIAHEKAHNPFIN